MNLSWLAAARDPFGALHKAALGVGAAMINNFIKMPFMLYDMENAFMKTTGANEEFARSLTNSYEATRQLGTTAAEVNSAYTELRATFTDFTMLSKDQRESVGETGILLEKLGVSNKSYAAAIQLTTKAMGQNAEQSADTARSRS